MILQYNMLLSKLILEISMYWLWICLVCLSHIHQHKEILENNGAKPAPTVTVAIDSERENSATAKSREHLDEVKTIWNRGSPMNHLSSHHSRSVRSTCSVFLRWAQLLFPKKLVKLLSTWKPIFSSEKLVFILYNIYSRIAKQEKIFSSLPCSLTTIFSSFSTWLQFPVFLFQHILYVYIQVLSENEFCTCSCSKDIKDLRNGVQ